MELVITEKNASICLNMIVKNESHIISNTLEKLCNKIQFDYWVICDTGSTDNTPQIITDFFQKKGIKGELFYDEWVNFAHNRTLALQRAFKKTQLLLVFDADDEIVGNITMPTNVLFDEYHLIFGSSDATIYTRVLLINNYKKFEYLSVIHEFISCKEGPASSTTINGDYYVVSGRTGSRNLDPDKYLKDALILEKAYIEAKNKDDTLFHRYSYYCANSYKDCGKFELAIKWYKITLSHPNQWNQEKYTSCLYIYECSKLLNQEYEGFFYLVKSFAYDTERVECLYPLLVHYCCENMHRVAYNYYLNVKDFFENRYLNYNISQKLFAVTDKYNFFVPYYMILIADKVQDFKCVIKMYEIVFIKKHRMFEEWYVKNFLYNLQFFIQHVSPDNKNSFVSLAREYMDFLHKNGVNLQKFDFLNKDVYMGAGLSFDKYIIKAVMHKEQQFSKNECASSKNILFYTGFSDIEWNYTYILNNALGGSEKAVAYISKCFPKDYNIFISGQVKNETIDNITYIHLNELTNLIHTIPFHTVIVSRYISFYELFPNCSFNQSYIWAHDTILLPYGCNLTDNQIIKKWNNFINGCICLTEWHKNLFIEKYPELKNKITLINNGLQLEHFTPFEHFEKVKNKFIYSSRPERGLDILLSLWPKILEKMPDATLSIATYGQFPSNPQEVALKTIIDSHSSIHYLGKLNVNNLYKEMKTSEYWLYPTHWPETSCITALEMLMSEVICVYYPVAGLPYTVDNYGIQVSAGKEIETIVSLTEEQKVHIRENGKRYAQSCSWEKRAELWVNTLSIKNINKNVAIFNGFPFHYQMYGFIISYCKENAMKLTIFTNFKNEMGWLDFYKKHFNTYSFEYIDLCNYELLKDTFDMIFITTDDDYKFKNEWFNDKCIVIDHYYKIRRPECKYRIATRPFIENNRNWSIFCHTIFSEIDKQNIQNNDINIAIIGGMMYGLNFNIINRLNTVDPNIKIFLHILDKNANYCDIQKITNRNIFTSLHNNFETIYMFDLLKNCDYILTDCTYNLDQFNGKSSSTAISIAFSTLTPLIISKQNNDIYKFENVIEYELESTDDIYIDNYTINYNNLIKEREKLISMFSTCINDICNIKNKIKIFVIHYKKLTERTEFMINQFKRENITNYEFITIDRDELTNSDTCNFKEDLNKPIIANFLSHIFAYKSIINNDFEYNLILEDDAILCNNFNNIIQTYIKQIPNDYDSVFIGNGCAINEHHIDSSIITNNNNVYKYDGENKSKCTDSYFISKKCANFLINYFNNYETKIEEPIDWFLNKPFQTLNVYWCEPTLVKQGTIIGLFSSSIGNGMMNYTGFNPNILTCYKPPFNKIRIGKDNDGGYLICDIPNITYGLLIGCGISNDISFETQFCDKYKDTLCHLYDGTIDNIILNNQNMTFFKKNINNFNDLNNTNLHDTIDNFDNIFLKMDIEGYEIPWIKSLTYEQLNKFSQIAIEFHFPFEDYQKDVFQKLNNSFLLVHFHPNNSCGVRQHNGVIIPNIFECTYLNRKFFNNNYELNIDTIPSNLDMKNIIDKDDIFIDYEPFVNKIVC